MASWLLLAALLLPTGRGLASVLTGRGLVWPRGHAAILASIGGLLTGHIDRGLHPAGRVVLPPTAVVYLAIVFVEILLTGLTFWSFMLWWHSFGPGTRDGMASKAEVRSVLGVENLRRRRALIRPDLHASGRDLGDDS